MSRGYSVESSIRLYLEHLPQIRTLLDRHQMPFYYHNPLFYISHFATDPSWFVEPFHGCLRVNTPEWTSVLPLSEDRAVLMRAVGSSVRDGRPVLRLPEWMEHLFPGMSMATLWPDYVGETAALQQMEGRKLKGLRQPIQRLERSGRTRVLRLGEQHEEAATALVRLWYRQRAPILGEMFQEPEITWLFSNLGWLARELPDSFGIGVEVDGVLVAVNLSCILTDCVWVCHTERYDNRAPTYANQLAFREACRAVDPKTYPWVNDGAAERPRVQGVQNLASFKARIAVTTVSPLGLWREEPD
jgi:Phosphatidylglycerol lysyltransferase, C-terminal